MIMVIVVFVNSSRRPSMVELMTYVTWADVDDQVVDLMYLSKMLCFKEVLYFL
jgi:hypothetical protein